MVVNPQEGMHLKKVVMESMLKFMRVMMLSPSTQSKKVILDMSYYWLSKNLNPKNLRKTPEQLNTDIRQILLQHELAPRSVIEQQLPSSKVAADLKEYRRGARTQHQELDAPEHQLQQYQLHKVTYLSQNMEPPESEGERWKRKLLKIKYDRPNLEQFYQEEDKPEGTGVDPVDSDAVEA